MKKTLLLILILCPMLFAQQITWTDVSSNYTLPEGVRLFKGTRTAPLLQAYYYDVDLNNPKVAICPYLASSNATVPALTAKFGAYGAVNGGFFGGSASYSAVVSPNIVKAQNIAAVTRNSKSYPLLRGFFGIKKDRSMSVDWIYHFGSTIKDIYTFNSPISYINNDPVPKAVPLKTQGTAYSNLIAGIGGGPVLVKNGQPRITYNEEIMWGSGVGLDNGDPRTAVGYTKDKHVLLIVADGRTSASAGVSLTELAGIMIERGCTEALNLDGGGSTQMSLGSKFVNTPSENRAINSILAIVNTDSLKLPKEPLFEKIIDTDDPSASLSGPGWFATSNPGFYGQSKAMLNGIGNGSKFASYKINVPAAAKYQVFAWWVSDANNRCRNTPFILKYNNSTDTVRLDQSKNGSQWNLIGEYSFTADTSNKLIISNAANTGTYIVADAIRIISYDTLTATSVSSSSGLAAAGDFRLSQNYPNPFNPATVINYYLPAKSIVNLKIFNILGREIATLVSGEQQAGEHNAVFAAQAGLSSGIYFYSIRAHRLASGASENVQEYFKTGKMVYLK